MDPLDIIKKHYGKHPEALKFLLMHSQMVTRKSLQVAISVMHLNPDIKFIEEAAMLHDIGMLLTDAPELGCQGSEHYIRHGLLGKELLEQEGLMRHALVCERHIGVGLTPEDVRQNNLPLPEREMSPVTLEEQIICFADKFYSKDEEPLVEKPVDSVRAMIEGFGPEKLKVFDEWLEKFGN